MKLDELTLGQIKELRCMLGIGNPTQEVCCAKDHGLQIVVLQRGWVYVGQVKQSGDYYELTDGACIRRWGTTKGIGQLATNGPTTNTELEPSETVRFHEAGKVLMVECVEDKWTGKIK